MGNPYQTNQRGKEKSQTRARQQEYIAEAQSEASTLQDDPSMMEKLPFAKFMIFAFANPRSGDGLAAGFLTEHASRTVTDVWFEERQQSVTCDLRFFNVIEKQERDNCLK
jgi:hypothetical protein